MKYFSFLFVVMGLSQANACLKDASGNTALFDGDRGSRFCYISTYETARIIPMTESAVKALNSIPHGQIDCKIGTTQLIESLSRKDSDSVNYLNTDIQVYQVSNCEVSN